MSNMFGALKSGAVEGSMVSPPTQFLSEKMGFKELLSVTDMDYAYPNPAMVTSGEMIRKKPDLIDRFMRAYVLGIHRARTDRGSPQSKHWRSTPPSLTRCFSARPTTFT
jgi:ABC-type nitrate/sulfonate/bicarbonate transport system substrate-binding protein